MDPRPRRSGDRVALASYLGKSDTFDQAITRFAEAYADQNDADYRSLDDAINTGQIQAQTRL